MTDHEKLVERYEDALFALLMDEVASQEGAQAIELNERLNADPRAAVPSQLQHKCEKTIRNAFAKQNMIRARRGAVRIFQRISVAVMVIVLLLTTAFAMSEPFRRMTLNALLAVEEQYSMIRFEEEQTVPPDVPLDEEVEYHYNIGLEWVPDGYRLVDGYAFKDGSGDVYYQNDAEHEFEVMVTRYSSGLTYQYDTEDAAIEYIEVQGKQAQLVTKEFDDTPEVSPYTRRMIIWLDDQKQAVFHIWGTHLSEAEVIQIAEGIHWNDQR